MIYNKVKLMIVMQNNNKSNKIQKITNKKINLKSNKKFKNKICLYNKKNKNYRMSQKIVNNKHNQFLIKLMT